jgi:hypothetical protein
MISDYMTATQRERFVDAPSICARLLFLPFHSYSSTVYCMLIHFVGSTIHG